jgi:polyisoprenyl-teichoic acid--peptidoglycan teichoic acid transferase
MRDNRGQMRTPLRRSAALAGFLSFVLPGLGQLWAGARRRGLLLLVPALVLVAVVAGAWIIDRTLLARAVLTPNVLLGLVALNLVVLGYRLWAVVDAYRLSRHRSGPREGSSRAIRASSVGVLIVLLVVTSLPHGWATVVGLSAHQTLTMVFSPGGPRGGVFVDASPSPRPSPTATPGDGRTDPPGTPTPPPTPTPTPPPDWATDGRLNVLLVGSDAGPGRWSLRADAIILVSVEIETGRVAAFSIPRYTTRVPLPEPAASAFECRCLKEPINALYVFANDYPDLFPAGGEHRGFWALQAAIEELAGVQVDGMAVVDLNGFVALVDAIGGVTVDVPRPVFDPAYPDPNGRRAVPVRFGVGEQRMDGWHALAYARTRHQDGDVRRMQRQQHVIQALQRELSCNPLGNLPAVLEVARDTVWTNLPLEDVPDMLRIDPGPVESHALFDVHGPALTPEDIERVRAAVRDAFAGPPPPPSEKPDCG